MEQKKTIKNKMIIIIFGLVIAMCIFVITSVFVFGENRGKKLEERLDLAEEYLSEQECEKAILAYEEIIEIDPKCEDAYLGLADVYIAIEEYEEAKDVLEVGYEETQSRTINRTLQEVEKLFEEATAEELLIDNQDELVQAEPVSPSWQEIQYIEDNIGIIDDMDSLEKTLMDFENITGITPHIITVHDSYWDQDYDDLVGYSYDLYMNHFTDEQHFLIVYSEPDDAENLESADWKWEAMQGDDTDSVLTEFNFVIFQEDLQRKLMNEENSVGEAFQYSFSNFLEYLMFIGMVDNIDNREYSLPENIIEIVEHNLLNYDAGFEYSKEDYADYTEISSVCESSEFIIEMGVMYFNKEEEAVDYSNECYSILTDSYNEYREYVSLINAHGKTDIVNTEFVCESSDWAISVAQFQKLVIICYVQDKIGDASAQDMANQIDSMMTIAGFY